MRILCIKYFGVTFLTLLSCFTYGQGCSDAGFCTLNSFKPNNIDSINEAKNQLKMGVSFGGADHSVSVFGSYLEYNRQLNDNLAFDAKLTSLMQSGNNILAVALSDIYLNANYKISREIKFTLGTKIPLTNGNKKKDNLSLPMDYQSSLGTYDIILGVGYEIKKVQLIIALQQPITQNNNGFTAENYPFNSKMREFQSTNKYKRNGDILLRVSYPIIIKDKFKITPSLLPIYHLANDKYTDVLGVEKDINGSQGLTLNGNAYFDYEINNKNAIQLNVGMPFLFRDTRPDGLTRSFVINLEYRVKL